MGVSSTSFKQGQVGNPTGRPAGTRNKRTQEILDLLSSRGDKDPLDFLSEVISTNDTYSPELKVTAANYLTPYLHSKRSVAAPAPRYIDSPVQVPEFQSMTKPKPSLPPFRYCLVVVNLIAKLLSSYPHSHEPGSAHAMSVKSFN